jgi:hypothetical protein
MTIDFNPNPAVCATYGYSFDYTCPVDGIEHSISQNWRVMVDPSGATFYATVTSVASVSTTTGPSGFTGLTGVTGMTGMTGVSGARGPQGLTFGGGSIVGRQSGIVFIPADAVNEPGPDGVTLDATEEAASVVFDNNVEYFKVSSVRENIPAASGTPTISDGFTTVNVDEGNNVKMNINASFDGITLGNMKLGDYANIIMTQAGPNALFKSDFKCSSYSSTQVNYASGITYNNGQNVDDIDVFYVSCVSGNGSGIAKVLVNHQRYHNGS